MATKRYNAEIKNRCKAKWVKGKSVNAIAKEEGISPVTISQWKKKYNWDDARQKLEKKTEEKAFSQLAEDLSELDKKQLEALGVAMEHILNLLNSSNLNPKEIELLLKSVLHIGQSNKQIRGEEKPESDSITNILFYLKEKSEKE